MRRGPIAAISVAVTMCCVNSTSFNHRTGMVVDSTGAVGMGGETDYCGELPVNLTAMKLAVPFMHHGCNKWCWADALGMLSTYYGDGTPPCVFATWNLGLKNNELPSFQRVELDCCELDICGTRCNEGGTDPQINFWLKKKGIFYRHQMATITADELERELSNGRPVMIATSTTTIETMTTTIAVGSISITRTSSMSVYRGHVLLIAGYKRVRVGFAGATFYHVLDPAQNAPTEATYEELRTGLAMPWTETWTRLAKRRDGCNPSFDPTCGCYVPP
ncbi:MAG: hypothetical protein AAB408_01560 [Patescibacteria group bacterium]